LRDCRSEGIQLRLVDLSGALVGEHTCPKFDDVRALVSEVLHS